MASTTQNAKSRRKLGDTVKTGRKERTRSMATHAASEAEPPKRSGRPPREFDPALADRMIESVRSGLPIQACYWGLVADSTFNRWICENETFAAELKKAQQFQLDGIIGRLRSSPAGLWQREAWLAERMYPHLFGLKTHVALDAHHKVEVNTKVCEAAADGWSKFSDNYVKDIEATVVNDKDGD